MGRKSNTPDHKQKQHKKRCRAEKSDIDLHYKIIKYASKGNTRKLKKLLKSTAVDVNEHDSSAQTVLHKACLANQLESVKLLLRYGAKADIQDKAGDTPCHIAARHGQLPLLAELLQSHTAPNVSLPNHRGVTIQELISRALEGGPPGSQAGKDTEHEACDSDDIDNESAWAQRLRDEYSDHDDTWDDTDDVFAGGALKSVGFDEWAENIWAQMQARKRREAEASKQTLARSLKEEAEERARRAAAAHAESKRILQEEIAKDAAWRQKALMGATLASRHAQYEARWLAIDSLASVKYQDVPWPFTPTDTPDQMRDFVLLGVEGPADIKKRLRTEILRWHPDKFMARLGGRLLTADAARIRAGVQEVSARLTSIMSSSAS